MQARSPSRGVKEIIYSQGTFRPMAIYICTEIPNFKKVADNKYFSIDCMILFNE